MVLKVKRLGITHSLLKCYMTFNGYTGKAQAELLFNRVIQEKILPLFDID